MTDATEAVGRCEEIFPLEVWEMIFDNLWVPKDLLACYQTCSTFQSLLYSRRSEFLFQKVFPRLTDYLMDSEAFFKVSNIINLRLVCRSWKYSVDSHFQQDFQTNMTITDDDFTTPPSATSEMRRVFKFQSVAAITKFTRAFKTPPLDRCPIFTNHIVFNDRRLGGGREASQFWKGAATLLDKFGGHIQSCELYLSYEHIVTFLYEKIILRSMALMPHLRLLKIDKEIGFGQTKTRREKQLKRLTSLMGRHSNVPELRNLSVCSMSHVPSVIVNQMLQAFDHPQMHKLMITNYSKLDEGVRFDFADLTQRFPNLEELVLPKINEVSALNTIPTGIWPLRRLELDVHIDSNVTPASISFPSLFDALSKLQTSVLEVKLLISGISHFEAGIIPKELQFEMPNVQKFTFQAGYKLSLSPGIDFLAEMKGLNHLNVRLDWHGFCDKECDHNEEDVVIQFSGFVTRMHESNIWKVLPKLKVLHLSDCHGLDRTYHRWSSTIAI